jgi:uncharacterized protein
MLEQRRACLKVLLVVLLVMMIFFAAGCSKELADGPSPVESEGGKALTEDVLLQGRKFTMELALTDEQRATGLMGRESLADDRGMLFVFPDTKPFPAEVSFWMKNCLMPIDVIFISREGKITAIHEMHPPLPGTPDNELTVYPSNGRVQFAIELRGGLAEELGLQVGDDLELRLDYLIGLAR